MMCKNMHIDCLHTIILNYHLTLVIVCAILIIEARAQGSSPKRLGGLIRAKTNEYFLLYRTGSIHPEIVCSTVDPQDACLLRSFYRWIGCEDIEIVRPTHTACRDVRELLIVVDGEGLLKSREQNAVASLLYAGRIVGDVLIGRQVIRDGEPDVGGWETVEEVQAAAASVFREVQHIMYMQPWRKGVVR